jgi:mersacidin/lichenicidin family type 2 lantibiotic
MNKEASMNKEDIIRAWKDKKYRQSLNPQEQALLPENPAGRIDLSEQELDQVNGGSLTQITLCYFSLCETSQGVCCSITFLGTCSLYNLCQP